MTRATPGQAAALSAYVMFGGSCSLAAAYLKISPSTVKRHLADLRAKFGLSTVQLIYRGRAECWLEVPDLEPINRAVERDSVPLVHAPLLR